MTTLPEFQTLDEVVQFWETHDSADYWDEMEVAEFDFDLRQNALHPGLMVLAEEPDICPRCQQPLEQQMIEYASWQHGHFVLVRDVLALRCRNQHEYILEETFDMIERLLALEARHALQPAEMLHVPVFTLPGGKERKHDGTRQG